jgi:hypothetical protein
MTIFNQFRNSHARYFLSEIVDAYFEKQGVELGFREK